MLISCFVQESHFISDLSLILVIFGIIHKFVHTLERSNISCLNLKSIANTNQYNNSNVIMIDEAQFFPDLFDFVTNAIDVDNKEIVIAGLDGDYKRQPFGDILKLIPHSDNIIKLKARCNLCDMENAIFTKRIVDSNKQFLVGGSESYIPVCRKHYIS